jgi:hypothetical protein
MVAAALVAVLMSSAAQGSARLLTSEDSPVASSPEGGAARLGDVDHRIALLEQRRPRWGPTAAAFTVGVFALDAGSLLTVPTALVAIFRAAMGPGGMCFNFNGCGSVRTGYSDLLPTLIAGGVLLAVGITLVVVGGEGFRRLAREEAELDLELEGLKDERAQLALPTGLAAPEMPALLASFSVTVARF